MRKFLVLIIATSALLASCGSPIPYAAKVNGTTITQADLDTEMKAIVGTKAYLDKIQEQSQQTGVEVLGQGKKTLSSAYVATLLNARIAGLLVHQELVRLKEKPTAEQVKSARDRYEQEFTKKVFTALPQSYQAYLVNQLAEFDIFGTAVQKGVTDAEVKEFFEKNKKAFEQVCVSHILVKTKAEADEIEKRLAAGEDFAEIAKQQSSDGSAAEGGSLGCVSEEQSSRFAPEFKAAVDALKPGETSPPVETQFGFHIIRVTEIKGGSLEEATPEIQQTLGDAQERLKELVVKAEIDLNPRFGKFVKEPLRGVVPPDAPATSTSSAPASPLLGG